MLTNIYALYHVEPSTHLRKYFYVGRSIDVPRRVLQHRRNEATGHEDKYAYMRTLRAKGLAWDAEVLREVPRAEHPWDHEHWHVVDLTRKGHELRNMRHGDRAHLAQLAAMVANPRIRSAADVRHERERLTVIAGARSKRLRREILLKTLAARGVRDLAQDGAVLPQRLRARLMREGITSIERGVPLSDLVRTARPSPQTRVFFAQMEAHVAAERRSPR